MVNTAALAGLWLMVWHVSALGLAIILGTAAGRPLRRRVIRRWVRRG